jgi:pyridoxamine 5'-phosphate oxidase
MDLARIRREYVRPYLDERELDADPLVQFRRWLADAVAADPLEPTAMTLATVGLDGQPSARIVLLKGCDERGFAFYTNYDSRKGRELAGNPRAALSFFWPVLDRQVRVEGRVEKLSRAESERYFASRPLGSRLGAWASRQSAVLGGREELERNYAEVAARFAGGPVPLPDFWGGYLLRPAAVEFWQGRESRLHDRFRYERAAGGEGEGEWTLARLSP